MPVTVLHVLISLAALRSRSSAVAICLAFLAYFCAGKLVVLAGCHIVSASGKYKKMMLWLKPQDEGFWSKALRFNASICLNNYLSEASEEPLRRLKKLFPATCI